MPREIVTSENREEYNEKKMAEKSGKPSLKMMKLYNKGLKQLAGSPKQKKTLEEIEKQKAKESQKGEEFDEKKIKAFMKKYRKNEDKNFHSENALALAKFLGHKEHEDTAKEIMDRHLKRGYLDEEDYAKRRNIEKDLWPRVSKYYEQE